MNASSLITTALYVAVALIVVGAIYAVFTLNTLAFAIAGLAGFVITFLYGACIGLYDQLRKTKGTSQKDDGMWGDN